MCAFTYVYYSRGMVVALEFKDQQELEVQWVHKHGSNSHMRHLWLLEPWRGQIQIPCLVLSNLHQESILQMATPLDKIIFQQVPQITGLLYMQRLLPWYVSPLSKCCKPFGHLLFPMPLQMVQSTQIVNWLSLVFFRWRPRQYPKLVISRIPNDT